MTPILYWPDADPDALIDATSDPLFDVNSEQLLATGDYTAARTFDSYGRGALVDCISCEVTEERNGSYELTMEYPISGAHFDDMELRCIIMAQPNFNDDPQAFRIYSITAPIDGKVTVLARHLSYDLSGIPVTPFTATSCSAACSGLISNALVASPFTIGTQIGTIADFKVDVPSSVRSWFGGKEGSLIDVYGGEWAYDNYTCTLKSSRGTDRGVVIRYGKNLIDFEQEKNCEEVYTGVLPYWADDEGHQIRTGIINVAGQYDYRRILVLDLSQDFEEQPTKAQLTTRANTYITANNIGVPKVNITLDWVQTSELSDRVDLCDTVLVEFERLGVSAKAKCISTTWDVLKDRYSRIEFGEPKTNITDTIAGMQDTEKKQETSVSNSMLRAIGAATAAITGNSGGHVVLHDGNGDGEPDELLVMNAADISSATKLWRLNLGGFGYSSSGYNGTYGTAITMDGEIVADYITAGTLQGITIIGETGSIGGWNLGQKQLYKDYVVSGSTYNVSLLSDPDVLSVFRINKDGETTAYINRNGYICSRNPSTGYYSGLYNSQFFFSDPNTNHVGYFRLYAVGSGYGVEVYGQNGAQIDSGSQLLLRGAAGTTLMSSGSTVTAEAATNLFLTAKNGSVTISATNYLFAKIVYDKTTTNAANVYVASTGSLLRSTSSSKRYKEGITEDLGELDPEKLYDLPVVRFRFKEDYIDKDDERAGKDVIGFIAEDVDELYPIAVRHEDGKAEMWESNYIIPAMMKLIQNQKKEIDELRARLDRLEARLIDDGR